MKNSIIPTTVTSNNGKVTARVVTKGWEKEGKVRTYITLCFDRETLDLGYIDHNNANNYEYKAFKGFQKDWKNAFEAALEVANA